MKIKAVLSTPFYVNLLASFILTSTVTQVHARLIIPEYKDYNLKHTQSESSIKSEALSKESVIVYTEQNNPCDKPLLTKGNLVRQPDFNSLDSWRGYYTTGVKVSQSKQIKKCGIDYQVVISNRNNYYDGIIQKIKPNLNTTKEYTFQANLKLNNSEVKDFGLAALALKNDLGIVYYQYLAVDQISSDDKTLTGMFKVNALSEIKQSYLLLFGPKGDKELVIDEVKIAEVDDNNPDPNTLFKHDFETDNAGWLPAWLTASPEISAMQAKSGGFSLYVKDRDHWYSGVKLPITQWFSEKKKYTLSLSALLSTGTSQAQKLSLQLYYVDDEGAHCSVLTQHPFL
ncbi:carbohydrate binding domain-containing protein [Zooshikella ganghwensis]|uniref:CBM-cenC domain-containing protein n=1 Tax=Zooshikella ganghwensis TaxID=202772 RepID=A0A4P9VSG1_9GAMM|nr:carbohydrate binding domain-containing protein [Zooshikella ganghwensis]RDH46588.1 hypothetical protein B9G39_25780 [Zooshikella ganghwensis]